MSCPFKIGQRWAMRNRPGVQATVFRILMSRERRNFEAWAKTAERYDGLHYQFDADDPTRSCDLLIDVNDWSKQTQASS